ncbi:acyl carrier protein [Streptacidiphilus sp. 4-A2]|nr:acyl carrier protein [Streptacidiphilus sp. 4-A2]
MAEAADPVPAVPPVLLVPPVSAVPGVPPTPARPDDASRALLDCVAETLGLPVDRMDEHRAPRDHGLDSLMAQRVSRSLRDSHGVDMPPNMLLGGDNLGSLMDRLRTAEMAQA